jgi:hypothetical protein
MSNAADGYLGDWLPHKDKCRCTECQLERVQAELATARQTIERLSAPVSDSECLAFERSYGEKLMLNYVDFGLSEFLEARKDAKA